MSPEQASPPTPLSPADFRVIERLRVRWAEVDAQQVVFNGHYLMYADTALSAWWRAQALAWGPTLEALGGDLFVRRSVLEHEAPARLDDVLEIGVRYAGVGRSSLRFEVAVFHEQRRLATVSLVYVWVDEHSRQPAPVPPALSGAFAAFEAGSEPVSVQVGDWARLQPAAQPVRTEVFVQEQQIPAELELDAADATAVHAVAFNALGAALGTGRLLAADAQGLGRIGRMAVRRPLRGSRVGRRVLDALVEAARARGDRGVLLHAQMSAAGFYLRAGFQPRGPQFEEAGIAHLEMTLHF